jgi:2-polyprenyl-6-methoxyphenol hydroxylase-like FAD-dependent oxidoreductase
MVDQRVDVCVIGAGVGGIACAQGLVRQGASVVLLERLHPMPDCLKAEKIGGEAVQALLRLGFDAAVTTALTPLHNVAVFFAERHLGTLPIDPPEAGLHYHTLVNHLREHLDPRIDFRPGTKAVRFDQTSDWVEVVTDTGQRIGARLVIMATGDARHLLEPLGATYESQLPHHVLAVALTLEGTLGDPGQPVDSQTYHRPRPDGPIAYATFFRLGNAIRANIFCQGEIAEDWQRDLKQRPLEVLTAQNRRLAAAARAWRAVSPVLTRKVQVARLNPPAVPRIVVLGDAAHTIDPAGAGGLTFLLTEVELLLSFYLPRWLGEEPGRVPQIPAFYADPHRAAAMERFFGGGRYIFALNHDASLRGTWRRAYFALRQTTGARLSSRSARPGPPNSPPWHLPAPYLYEHYPVPDRT